MRYNEDIDSVKNCPCNGSPTPILYINSSEELLQVVVYVQGTC